MSFSMPDLMGLAMALHGYGSPQAAQKDPGFLSRYTQATQNPLTSPTQPAQSGPGLLSVLGDATQGKFQPGSVAAGVSHMFTPGTPANPISLPEQSVTAPHPTQAPQGGPGGGPGAGPGGPVSGPPAPLMGAPLPPQRPSDQDLAMAYQQPRTDAPDPHGPIGSTPTIWGANYHGPEASLFNRLAAQGGPSGDSGSSGGPGSGLQAFTQSGAPKDFASAAGPNLLSFLDLS